VGELNWDVVRTLTGLVCVDVVLACFVVLLLPLDTQLGQETSDVLHQFDCLLPGADVLVDLVKQVGDASVGELQTALAVGAIAGVSSRIVVGLIPWAIEGSLKWTWMRGVLTGEFNWRLLWVAGL